MSLKAALIEKYSPESVNPVQWLNGRATRHEVMDFLQTTVDQLDDIKKYLIEAMTDFDKKANQYFAAMRLHSHQIDTLVRMGGIEKQAFYAELRKTMAFGEFIDSLISKRGVHYNKTMREKVEMLQGWNKQEDMLKCDFDVLQLQQYISDFPADFSKAEIEELQQEFNFAVGNMQSSIIIGDNVNVEQLR
jgi:hypothetical protein